MTTPQNVNADPTTVQIGTQPIQVCPALGKGATVLIFNNDLLNVAYAGYKRDGVGLTNTVIIAPLASVTIDASRAVYAFTPVGTVSINVIPGGLAIGPSPVQVAQQLALSGTPLLMGFNWLEGPAASINVPAGGTNSFTVTFTRPGYMIDFYATIAAAATIPWVMVELLWQDASSMTIIDKQHWFTPCTSAGIWRNTGNGPAMGPKCTVTFTNFDPAQAATVIFSFGQTTQYGPRHDIRTTDYWTAKVPLYPLWVNTPPVGGNNLARGDMSNGILVSYNSDNIGAGQSFAILLPLYSGAVWWQFAGTTNIQGSVRLPAELGAINSFDGATAIWFDNTITTVTVQLVHPRCPMVLNFSNPGAATTFSTLGVMLEP